MIRIVCDPMGLEVGKGGGCWLPKLPKAGGDSWLAVSSPSRKQEATSYLEKKKELVKPRPQQDNRNRIVWSRPSKRRSKTARCVLHSSVAHKLRNGSPRGYLGNRHPRCHEAVPGPAFLMPITDARSRQAVTGRARNPSDARERRWTSHE
ncbi:hypothetical protein L209DRAFT_757820 [Thermothelomyces heterothallicus CBS 203.75]